MKAKKKSIRTKAQIRAMKERKRRITTAIFLPFILLIVAISAYFTYSFINQSPNQPTKPTPLIESSNSRPAKPHIPKPNLRRNSHRYTRTSQIHERPPPKRKRHSGILQKPTDTQMQHDNFKGAFYSHKSRHDGSL
jgi:hypothetical protein